MYSCTHSLPLPCHTPRPALAPGSAGHGHGAAKGAARREATYHGGATVSPSNRLAMAMAVVTGDFFLG